MGLVQWNTELFKAVVCNNVEGILSAIEKGADVNAEFTIKGLIDCQIFDENAVAAINSDIFFSKVPSQTDAQKPGPSIEPALTALQLAVLYGWRESIIELTKRGADPNVTFDTRNSTVIHILYTVAAMFNHHNTSIKHDEDIIQLLFDYGADPNITDIYDRTALMYATVVSGCSCVKKYVSVIELLLINGANPKIKDHLGTPLWYKIKKMDSFIDPLGIIKLILDHDTHPAVSDLTSELKQYVNRNNQLIEAIKGEKRYKVEKLLKQGVSSNIRDGDGFSALHLAKNNHDITKLLLDNKANPNIKTWKNGMTPLFNAVIKDKLDIAELLLKNGANPNILNKIRVAPLYYSVTSKNTAMTELLLKYNADPDIANQICIPFAILSDMYADKNMALIEAVVEKIEAVVLFLNEKGISVKYIPFYKSAIIADKNDLGDIGKRMINLVNSAIPQM